MASPAYSNSPQVSCVVGVAISSSSSLSSDEDDDDIDYSGRSSSAGSSIGIAPVADIVAAVSFAASVVSAMLVGSGVRSRRRCSSWLVFIDC